MFTAFMSVSCFVCTDDHHTTHISFIVFLLIHPVQNSQPQISIQHYKSQHNSFRTPEQKKDCTGIDHVFYVISGAIYQYNLYNFIRLHVEIKCTDFFVCNSCV